MADQREFPVPHPEFIAVGPTNQTLVIFHEDGGAAFLDLHRVTGIDRLPSAAT
jgi:hypothetical protein